MHSLNAFLLIQRFLRPWLMVLCSHYHTLSCTLYTNPPHLIYASQWGCSKPYDRELYVYFPELTPC